MEWLKSLIGIDTPPKIPTCAEVLCCSAPNQRKTLYFNLLPSTLRAMVDRYVLLNSWRNLDTMRAIRVFRHPPYSLLRYSPPSGDDIIIAAVRSDDYRDPRHEVIVMGASTPYTPFNVTGMPDLVVPGNPPHLVVRYPSNRGYALYSFFGECKRRVYSTSEDYLSRTRCIVHADACIVLVDRTCYSLMLEHKFEMPPRIYEGEPFHNIKFYGSDTNECCIVYRESKCDLWDLQTSSCLHVLEVPFVCFPRVQFAVRHASLKLDARGTLFFDLRPGGIQMHFEREFYAQCESATRIWSADGRYFDCVTHQISELPVAFDTTEGRIHNETVLCLPGKSSGVVHLCDIHTTTLVTVTMPYTKQDICNWYYSGGMFYLLCIPRSNDKKDNPVLKQKILVFSIDASDPKPSLRLIFEGSLAREGGYVFMCGKNGAHPPILQIGDTIYTFPTQPFYEDILRLTD